MFIVKTFNFVDDDITTPKGLRNYCYAISKYAAKGNNSQRLQNTVDRCKRLEKDRFSFKAELDSKMPRHLGQFGIEIEVSLDKFLEIIREHYHLLFSVKY